MTVVCFILKNKVGRLLSNVSISYKTTLIKSLLSLSKVDTEKLDKIENLEIHPHIYIINLFSTIFKMNSIEKRKSL